MNDTFLEKIVSRRKTGKDYLKIVGLLAAAFVLIFIVMIFGPYFAFLVPLILVGVIYGLWFFLSGLNREYEYIVTNGEIDIDMIIAKRKRKRVFSGKARDFEIMAKIDSDDYQQAQKGNYEVMDFSSIADNKENWFFTAEYKSKRVLVLFEPDERMLESFKRHNPSKVKFNRFGS